MCIVKKKESKHISFWDFNIILYPSVNETQTLTLDICTCLQQTIPNISTEREKSEHFILRLSSSSIWSFAQFHFPLLYNGSPVSFTVENFVCISMFYFGPLLKCLVLFVYTFCLHGVVQPKSAISSLRYIQHYSLCKKLIIFHDFINSHIKWDLRCSWW